MAVVNIDFITKLDQTPFGKPLKQVDAVIYTAALEHITAADLGLKTVYTDPDLTSKEPDYTVSGSVNSPGSPSNYIVVDLMYIATSGAAVQATGSHYVKARVVGD